jgi:hypothetical protein
MMDTCTVTKVNNNTQQRTRVTYSGTWSNIDPIRYEGSLKPPKNASWYFKLSNDISDELDDCSLDIEEDFIDYDDNGVLGWYSTTDGCYNSIISILPPYSN